MVINSADGVTEYTYDALGQLLTETKGSQTVSVTYDKFGNIQSKNGISYSYGSDDANCCGWKDLLATYNGKAIHYDENGNPINYQGTTAAWEKGRQLKTFGTNSYKYNNDGIRIQKRTATEIHDYILDGTNILKELVTDTSGCPKYTNEYLYDLDGTVCGIKHNDTAYYFYKNLQGDIIAIANANGVTVAQYTYDAWGVPTIKEDTSGCNIATINPFRYRGYYYDAETKFYYLQSRYYDPEVGRFINADNVEYLSGQKNHIGFNLYSHCLNNVLNTWDPYGNWVLSIGVEGQAAFILGAYGSVVVNIDGNWNVSITYSIGFAIITNIAAYAQVCVTFYAGKKNVSDLNGWGISLGASFSIGAHISAGGNIDLGLDRSRGGNFSFGYGAGVSIAPVPYYQTRVGYTGTIKKFNLLSALRSWSTRWKNSYRAGGLRVEIRKGNGYIVIEIRSLKRTVVLYKNGKVQVS